MAEDAPYKTDFFSEIVDVHFGGDGPYLFLWAEKLHFAGPAFSPATTVRIENSSGFTVPSRTLISPSLTIQAAAGGPGGTTRISNTFTRDMQRNYDTWMGANAIYADAGAPADKDMHSYIAFNIGRHSKTQVRFNLRYVSTAENGEFIFCVGTFRKAFGVAYAHGTGVGTSEDGLNVIVDKHGTRDLMGNQFVDPAYAVGFQRRQFAGGIANQVYNITADPKTLALSVSPS
jgi:hypothetical protein